MGSYEHPTIDGAHKRSRELRLVLLPSGSLVIHHRGFLEVYTLVHTYYMLSLEQVAENLLELTLPVKMSVFLSAVRYLERQVRFTVRRYTTPGTSRTVIGTPKLDYGAVNRSPS